MIVTITLLLKLKLLDDHFFPFLIFFGDNSFEFFFLLVEVISDLKVCLISLELYFMTLKEFFQQTVVLFELNFIILCLF